MNLVRSVEEGFAPLWFMTLLSFSSVRWSLAALLFAGSAVSFAFACGLSQESISTNPDATAATDAGDDALALCPSPTDPALHDLGACAAPDGTTCPATNCAGMFAVCQLGVWHFSTVAAQLPVCPSALPQAGESCPACWQNSGACYYQCGPGETSKRARCRNLGTTIRGPTWSIDDAPCEGADAGPAADGGFSDGSAVDAAPLPADDASTPDE